MIGLFIPIVVLGVILLGLAQRQGRLGRLSGAGGDQGPDPNAVAATPEQIRRRPPPVAEAVGYVGAVLAMVGVVQLVGRSWSSFEQPVRIGLLGGLAAALLVAGLLLRDEDEPAIWRLRGFVMLLSTAALAGCAGVVFVDSFEMTNESVTIGIGLVVAGYSALLWMLRDRPAQQATTFIGIVEAVAGTVALWDGAGAVGLSITALGGIWVFMNMRLGQHARSVSVQLGLIALLVGPATTFESFREVTPVIGLAVSLAVVVVGTRLDEFFFTGAGVLGIMGYLPFGIAQWFGDTLQVSGVMVVSGLMLLGAMLVIMRRRSTGPRTPGHHASGVPRA